MPLPVRFLVFEICMLLRVDSFTFPALGLDSIGVWLCSVAPRLFDINESEFLDVDVHLLKNSMSIV